MSWAFIIGALPEILLTVYIMILLMVGVFSHTKNAFSYVYNLSLIGFIWIFGIIFSSEPVPYAFDKQLIFNGFTQYMKLLILLAGFMSLLMAKSYITHHNIHRFEYPIIILCAVLGMMIMVSANNFIVLYMGLELQSLALYVLATFHRDNSKSSEAGLKYFVLGAVSSGLFLFGVSYIYGFTGTIEYHLISDIDNTAVGLLIGLVFVISALAFKVSAAPFHMWTPDVYEGAPTSVTAFFAVAPKVAALTVLLQILYVPLWGLFTDWQSIIVILSIFSMVIGAYGAITQYNIKRLMAYSAIGHMGYALMGIASGTDNGVQSVIIYMTIYLFMNVGVFAIVMLMRHNHQEYSENINDLKGLAKYNPRMAAAMMVLMFSMAGIPPLAGFFSKLYVFMAAVNAGLIILAIIGALASVISAFYYLRIIKIMYFDDVEQELLPLKDNYNRILMYSNATISVLLLIAIPFISTHAYNIALFITK